MRRSSDLWRLTAILLGVGMALLAVTPPAAAQLANSAWPMLQHDERHSGRSPLLGPNFPSGAPAPEDVAVWTGFDKVKSSPTIAPDGTIYVGVAWSVCAIDPTVSNGVLEDLWAPLPPTPRCRRLVADASPSSAAIAADGTMYIGDRGNTLNAFKPDGTIKWRYRNGSEGDLKTSPVIGPDGTIYFVFVQNLDGPGALTAVNSGEPPPLGVGGTAKWSYTGGNFANTSSPALDNGVVSFGDLAGWFHAVQADTGVFLWKLKVGNQISASPVIVPPGTPHAGRIYVGSTNGLSAVDPNTHALDPTFAAATPTPGTFTTDGMVDETPALAADGTIYAGSKSSKRRTVYAINPDGTQKWVFGPVLSDSDHAAFPVVSAEGTIYVGIGKTVYALRPTDGTVLWSYTVPMFIISFPALGGDATPETGGTATLYVPSYDGNLYALSSFRGPQASPPNHPPTAQANASTTTAVPGQHIVFSGSGFDPDNDPLTFTWNFGDGSTFAGTSVMHVYAPSPPGSYPVTYPVTLTVTDGIWTSVASIPIRVNQPAGPFAVTDNFNRASSTNLGSATLAGPPGQVPWAEVGGDQFSISGNVELRNNPGTGDHIAILPSVTGPAQTVAADFASVDNGPVPRFGIILRYQDSQNYYLAYRKPGNASVLRIAKIVGGLETVLAQMGAPNPQVNTFFRLSATAAGTAISLDLNGVTKLSVDDIAFSAGSIGILVNPGTSSTAMHRVDNVTANVQ
jgi:outer membrane protein assembly factor BamB